MKKLWITKAWGERKVKVYHLRFYFPHLKLQGLTWHGWGQSVVFIDVPVSLVSQVTSPHLPTTAPLRPMKRIPVMRKESLAQRAPGGGARKTIIMRGMVIKGE